MSTITLKNLRTTADVTMNTRLKDGGVFIDWAALTDIKAWLYSDAQKAIAGRCDVSISQADSTKLVCGYAATKPQYLGVNRLIVQAQYMGELKTYDKPAFNFVRWTADQEGTPVVISDPDVDVDIEVADVSSSILEAAIAAALQAAADAEHAAHLIPNQVLLDCEAATTQANAAKNAANDAADAANAAAGRAPYIGENGHWWVWDTTAGAYVDSGNVAKGDTGNGIASWNVVESQEDGGNNVVTVTFTDGNSETFNVKNGATGATPNITIGTVTTGEPGDPAAASMGGTAAAPVLNLTIPKGQKGDQGNTGSSVDYPFELVNNETTDDATKAHTAAGAKRLKDEVTQLELKVDEEIPTLSQKIISIGTIIVDILKKAVYKSDDVDDEITELEQELTGELLSVDAEYTQPGTIYAGQSLDDLRNGLVVTANYMDGTSVVVTAYTLSGSLTSGTSTITVTYGYKTDTFTVIVTDAVYYRSGDNFAYQAALRQRSNGTGASGSTYDLVIDGVHYVYAFANYNDANKQRTCYYLFDILLTGGNSYRLEIPYSGLPEGKHIVIGVQSFDSTFYTAGVANTRGDMSSHNNDSGWLTPTVSDGTYILDFSVPSGDVGSRFVFMLRDGSDNGVTWPASFVFNGLAVRELN